MGTRVRTGRASFGAEIELIYHWHNSLHFLSASYDIHLFYFLAIRRVQYSFLLVVRFRSHSLLPRDMADSAFVSSTGDVEDQSAWSTLGCPFGNRGHSSTKPGRTRISLYM